MKLQIQDTSNLQQEFDGLRRSNQKDTIHQEVIDYFTSILIYIERDPYKFNLKLLIYDLIAKFDNYSSNFSLSTSNILYNKKVKLPMDMDNRELENDSNIIFNKEKKSFIPTYDINKVQSAILDAIPKTNKSNPKLSREGDPPNHY